MTLSFRLRSVGGQAISNEQPIVITQEVVSTPVLRGQVAYGNGNFVSIVFGIGFVSDGVSMTSSDNGETWTARTVTDSLDTFPAIAFGDGVFVVKQFPSEFNDDEGWNYYSADGISWSRTSMVEGYPGLYDEMVFAGGNFFSGYHYSSDGITFSTTDFNARLGILHDGSEFIGTDSLGDVYAGSNADFSNAVLKSGGEISNFPSDKVLLGVVHDGTRFVGVCADPGNASINSLMSSSDGLNWTKIRELPAPYNSRTTYVFVQALYNNGVLFFRTWSDEDIAGVVILTTDDFVTYDVASVTNAGGMADNGSNIVVVTGDNEAARITIT
jgi:hypothetical protein